MSLYNQLFGENKDAMALIGALGLTRDAFGRYRDVYVNKDGTKIIVYTRCGGGNRLEYEEIYNTMKAHPNYICDYDDDFDETYSYIEFSVPEKYSQMCKSMATGEEPISVSEKFKIECEEMNKPGSDTYKRADKYVEQLINRISEDMNNDGFEGGITIIKL